MIYFDNSATTQVLPEVLSTYNAVSEKIWGNPSSLHAMGEQAFNLLEQSRKQIADLEKKYDEEQGKLLLSKNDEYLVKKKEGRYGDVLILEFEGENVNALKQLTSNLITKLNNGICFIINKNNNSLNFIARSSDSIADKINIGALIKDVSLLAEGNGGGSKTFAQGGGSSLENLDVIKKYLKDNIIEKE